MGNEVEDEVSWASRGKSASKSGQNAESPSSTLISPAAKPFDIFRNARRAPKMRREGFSRDVISSGSASIPTCRRESRRSAGPALPVTGVVKRHQFVELFTGRKEARFRFQFEQAVVCLTRGYRSRCPSERTSRYERWTK